jgi:hypothetical protein
MGEHGPACLHNPASGHEQQLPQHIEQSAHSARKVVIVGGGPAGLEAARVCAERGHRVVLLEAADALGGQLRLACRGSWRRDLGGIIDWRAAEIRRLGVSVRLNCLAESADILAEQPDIVVVATGGVPNLEWIDGSEWCTSVWDELAISRARSGTVIVIDATGRHPALLAADKAAHEGNQVHLVSIDDAIGAELTYAERVSWKRWLGGLAITPLFDHRLIRVRENGEGLTCTLQWEYDDRLTELRGDRVVIEAGTLPADSLYQDLRGGSCNNGVTDLDALLGGRPQPWTGGTAHGPELYRIGDAVSSRDIHAAVLDALRLCATL